MKFCGLQTLRRSYQILQVGAKYFLFRRFFHYRGESLGVRLRLACEELGLVFIKIGQIMSTRYDLLSKEDCLELQKLLDEVPPVPYEAIKNIFLADFGIFPEKLFQNWDPAPLASASVAQVYRAVIAGHSEVAVKVRRPNIDRHIQADLEILKFFGTIAQFFSKSLRQIRLGAVFSQIESWLLAEIDFGNEIINLEEIAHFYKSRAREIIGNYADALVFPRVYRNYSSVNVITMEFIPGIPVRQFRTVENNQAYDVFASLKVFMSAMMRVWMSGDEFIFPGDPHPSNLLLLPGGKLAVLDLGLVGRYTARDTQETRDLLLAVYAQDVEKVIRLGLQMSGVSYDAFASRMREDVRKFLAITPTSGMAFWFRGFAEIFLKHRIPFPYHLILVGRMQTVIEGLFETVRPGTRTLDVFGEELARGLRRKIIRNFLETDFGPALFVLSEKIKKSPRLVAGLISKYFENPLQAVRDFKEALGV